MADYILGLSISSFVALVMGIKQSWRIFSQNGLHNSFISFAVMISSFFVFGFLNSTTSNVLLGFLGIVTFPSYVIFRATTRRQDRARKNKTINAANVSKPLESPEEVNREKSAQLLTSPKTKPAHTITKAQSIERSSLAEIEPHMTTALIEKQHVVKDVGFPDWHISISFGNSRSENFPQARGLAMMAPKYLEHTIEGKAIHQAVYSSQPTEYLAFVKLYELVSNWKSCFVVINGQVVDRKIVGGLNYCYGDRCRSGNPEFCYGASYMTANPFGCHRIQISAYNNPWWTFGRFDSRGIWLVNKEAMLKRIVEYSEPYRLCPAFSIDNVIESLKNLPDIINPKEDKNWIATGSMVTPARSQSALEFAIRLNITGSEENTHLDRS